MAEGCYDQEQERNSCSSAAASIVYMKKPGYANGERPEVPLVMIGAKPVGPGLHKKAVTLRRDEQGLRLVPVGKDRELLFYDPDILLFRAVLYLQQVTACCKALQVQRACQAGNTGGLYGFTGYIQQADSSITAG